MALTGRGGNAHLRSGVEGSPDVDEAVGSKGIRPESRTWVTTPHAHKSAALP